MGRVRRRVSKRGYAPAQGRGRERGENGAGQGFPRGRAGGVWRFFFPKQPAGSIAAAWSVAAAAPRPQEPALAAEGVRTRAGAARPVATSLAWLTSTASAQRSRFRAASSHFEALGPGVFWLNASVRGEGLNLADFGAAQYGPAFTVETGLIGDFAARVAMQKLTVQTAVKVFEERYA